MKKGNGSGIMEKLKVVIENKQKTVKIPTGIRLLIRRCCHAVLEMENFEGSVEVDVSLVDNAQIREINREHRHIDAVTDVLSFPLGENGHYDINPETGAKMLLFHSCHNVSKDEWEAGATYLSLMRQNAENLKEGLS